MMGLRGKLDLKRVFSSLIFILILTQCISGSAIKQKHVTPSEKSKKLPLTIEDYVEGLYTPAEFNVHWVRNSDQLVYKIENGTVNFYNISSGQNETILTLEEITDKWDMDIADLYFSKDLDYAIIKATDFNKWSVTPTSCYLIFDRKTRNVTVLGNLTEVDGRKFLQPLQLVTWTPTGHGIVYVANNNIYYKADAKANTPDRQITFDGSEKSWIFNGLTTWNLRTGEGDAIDDVTSLWISPSSTHLVFLKYNDSLVPEMQWPVYGEPGQDEQIYPEYRKVRYPMPGFNISIVDVYLVSLMDKNSKPTKIEFKGINEKDLVGKSDVTWCTNYTFIVPTRNRQETKAIWHLCDVNSTTCKQVYNFTLTNGWIPDTNVGTNEDGTQFVFTRPVQLENETWSYQRIVLFRENGTQQVLTRGNLSVLDLSDWDETQNLMYFSGTFWNSSYMDSTESHVYSVNTENLELKCITCSLKNSKGHPCLSNSAEFSYNFTYFIHTCDGPDIPEVTTRCTKTGEPVEHPGPTNVNNSAVRTALANKIMPTVKEYRVPIIKGYMARARVYFPENLDSTKKYPLLVKVYAGPGSNEITQAYQTSWEKTLASRKNVIVASIDGRGSGRQSTELMYEVHRKLGTAEIEDQIAVTKWLLQNEPLIDPNKTSIWGWSYGGYATIKVLETDTENIFKCGMAVAPVTDWRRYLAPYTDCYMGLVTDKENFLSFNESRVTRDDQVENLRNKTFLLIHGTADARVHFLNSMLLARSLQKNNVMYQQLTYPNEGHGLSYKTHKHLYQSLERFLFRSCYKMPHMVD